MSKNLLPCPFCGGEAEIERMGTRRQSCQVACTNCGAHHEGPDEDEHSGDSWNRRAALDGEWQSEIPTKGEWWVSARPEVRKYWLPHKGRVRVPVTVDALGVMNKGRRWDKDASVFTGALWQRRAVPGDPFKGGGE